MAEWTTAHVNDLPDSAFLYVEGGGEKDGEGKTTPRSLRHFPYKGADGKVDVAHLRNALARIPQSDIPAAKKASLTTHATKLLEQANGKTDAGDWDEGKHPRAPNGQFGEGGGGSSKTPEAPPERHGEEHPRVKEWAEKQKNPVSTKVKGWLSKASESVRSFFTDKEARGEAFKKIGEKLRNAPKELKDKVVEKVREHVKEAKLAAAGINANLHGQKMSAEQKHATKKIALEIGIAVAAHVVAGGLPLHFIASEAGRKVAEQIGHHLCEKAMERLAKATTGIELDAGDELDVLAKKLLAAMADEADDIASSDDISELLESLADGDEKTDAYDRPGRPIRHDHVALEGERVYRCDLSGSMGKHRRTPQGGLIADGRLTRVGVLSYLQPDGSVRREFRPPEEVFNEDSLASLAHAPVTIDHPAIVDPDNWQDVTVGHVAGMPERDGDYVASPLRLHTRDAIDQAEDGKLQELSCGYSCTLDRTPGIYNGQAYDAVQRNIRYNHVAAGPEGWGRAGPEVRMRLDSAFGELGSYVQDTMPDDIKLREAQTALTQATADLEAARQDAKTAKTEADRAAAKERETAAENARLRAENEVLKLQAARSDSASTARQQQDRQDAAVAETVSAIRLGERILGTDWKHDGKKAVEIKREVLAHLEPELGKENPSLAPEKLDGAALDVALDQAVRHADAARADRGDVQHASFPRADAAKGMPGAEGRDEDGDYDKNDAIKGARDSMIARNKDAWKTGKKWDRKKAADARRSQ